ncbi:MAG: PAS domain-containing protein [Desulfovibrio sp.]|jgi:signal transduction histidine kinase|nr:PAS domain-containing protein [Desulfovibrio sp.]
MEIAEKTKERNTVILAVLTLVIIGATVMLSTRQTFRHQRDAEEQHLFLTSRAVYLSIENSVRRGPVREGENRLSPRTADFFQALEQDGDVLFVGIVDEHGERLLTSPVHGNAPIDLPQKMVTTMLADGEWHGRLILGKRGAYVFGKRLEPLRGMHMSLRDDLGPPGFLVVGIDMEKHLSAYAGFRRNVLLQALYILAAAVITWAMGWSFLARREQAGKAAALELFQARLLDNLPDGLITVDPDGLVRSANPAALSILRFSAKELLGKPVSVLPRPIAARVTDPAAPSGGNWAQVTYGRAKLEVLALPMSGDKDNAWLLILRDRTQMRNLEKSLADAEKLAAVGTLAAGVAHEVRNPLSSLRGFAQYFVKKLAGRTPEEEYAKTMVREADRLNRVITDLLFLGRPKAISPRRVDIESLAGEILALLRFDLEQKKLDIDLVLRADTVYADADSLKQALLNLLLNSIDALEGPADVRRPAKRLFPPALEARPPENGAAKRPSSPLPDAGGLDEAPPAIVAHADVDPAFPSLPDLMRGGPLRIVSGRLPDAAYIEVQDTGRGMSREQRGKAFEAFFTDKENGTGLGLALVRRTMTDHGGAAHIASEPGKGCTVRLLFPEPRPGKFTEHGS